MFNEEQVEEICQGFGLSWDRTAQHTFYKGQQMWTRESIERWAKTADKHRPLCDDLRTR